VRHARFALAGLALAAVLSLTACGGDRGKRDNVDPEALLDSAFSHPIPTSITTVDFDGRVDGVPQLSGNPVKLSVEGPYISGNGMQIPSVDWRVNASAGGFNVGGKVVSTGHNVFLTIFGDGYQVGEAAVEEQNAKIRAATAAAAGNPPPLANLGVHPREWFGNATYEGDEEVAGVDTAHVTAHLRGDQVVEDLHALSNRLGLNDASPAPEKLTPAQAKTVNDGLHTGRIEAWVGIDDEIVRELKVETAFTIAPDQRDDVRGATGGELHLDILQEDVGEDQEVHAPSGVGVKPIRDLLLSLNDFGLLP
jgi:hypothetical protein